MTDMMPIKDIAGLSEPITKLIETVSNAIGTIYEPKRIRLKAQAEAEATIIQAQAEAQKQSIEYFASERIKYLEIRRQHNIEKITEFAENQLPNKVSSEKVDEDWTVQFFNIAQDVNSEEMQLIWGKLLAGEISQPGSFSLFTINTLKMLSQKDAINFKRLCNYAWADRNILGYYAIYDQYFPVRGLDWGTMNNFQTLGLLNFNIGWTKESGESLNLKYFDELYQFTNKNSYKRRIEGLGLSIAGRELLKICDREPDDFCISKIIETYSKSPFNLTITKI